MRGGKASSPPTCDGMEWKDGMRGVWWLWLLHQGEEGDGRAWVAPGDDEAHD